MGKKTGKACNAVEPQEAAVPEEFKIPNPGQVEEVSGKTIQDEKSELGSQKAKPFKPPTEEEAEENEEELSWIEIELVDEEGEPVPGEAYEITLSDDTVATGTLDGKGFARLDGIPKGNCKVSFPKLDKEAWEKA